MAQTLSSSPLSETTLSSSPLSDTMKLSAGEVGVSVAMLPQRCWRSAAGSVWVRVVSVFASCASEVALLGVRPQQLGSGAACRQARRQSSLAPKAGRPVPSLPGSSTRPEDQPEHQVELGAQRDTQRQSLHSVQNKHPRGGAPVHRSRSLLLYPRQLTDLARRQFPDRRR